jgi:hypothetical protein
MGLDMYAVRKIQTNCEREIPAEQRHSVQIAIGDNPVRGIDLERIISIDESVMYWRKANHIHKWFVDNVQDGNDDQREYRVGWDQLEALLTACNKVIEAPALPDRAVIVGTEHSKEHPDGLTKREPGKVLKRQSAAKRLLPRCEGFFFGSQEYDEDYLTDVIETRDWIVRMLDDRNNGVPGAIYYSSWW